VVIVNKEFCSRTPYKCNSCKGENAYTAFASLLEIYNKMKHNKTGISEKSCISDSAKIGTNVYIGAMAFIGDNVVIGNNVKIYPQCYIGDNVQIKDNTTLYASVTLIFLDTQVGVIVSYIQA